jgi:hypothetical protein
MSSDATQQTRKGAAVFEVTDAGASSRSSAKGTLAPVINLYVPQSGCEALRHARVWPDSKGHRKKKGGHPLLRTSTVVEAVTLTSSTETEATKIGHRRHFGTEVNDCACEGAHFYRKVQETQHFVAF